MLKNWYFSLHIVVTNNISAPENKGRNQILTKFIMIKSIHTRTKATWEKTVNSSED